MKATYLIGSGRPLFELPGGKFFGAFTQRLVRTPSPSDRAVEQRKAA